MKTRNFTLSLLFAGLVVAVFARSVNADVVRISTDDDGWGSVYTYAAKVAYAARGSTPGVGYSYKDNGNRVTGKIKGTSNVTYTADSWNRRKSFAEYYLSNSLGATAMTNQAGKQNSALTNSISALYDPKGASWNSDKTRRIFGNAATTISGDPITANITSMMTPNGQNGARIITSSAWHDIKVNEGERDWKYSGINSTSKKEGFINSGSSTARDGVGGVVAGIYTFVKGFDIDTNNVYENIDGWFSVLGTFVGIYLNGVELTPDYMTLSQATKDSTFFGSYKMSIDLAKLMSAGLLSNGNNNLAFMIDATPLEYIANTVVQPQIYHAGADTLVGFSSNMNVNYNSRSTQPTQPTQPAPSATPEPATLLIFGMGMIGLGLRRKFMGKKVVV